MAESMQKKLGRVRPPRVQITYDVETGGAIEVKEIPFIVGILANLSGEPANPLPPMRERKFVAIDRDNFNQIMKSVQPRLLLKDVANKLSVADNAAAKPLSAELVFNSIDEFEPVQLLKKIDLLQEKYRERSWLKDFLAKLDGNDALDALLTKLLYPETIPAGDGGDEDENKKFTELKAALPKDYEELQQKLQANLEAAKLSRVSEKLQKQIQAALDKDTLALADLSQEDLNGKLPPEYAKQLEIVLNELNGIKSWKDIDGTDPAWKDEREALWGDENIPASLMTVIGEGQMTHDESQNRYASILVGQFIESVLPLAKPPEQDSDESPADATGLTVNHISEVDEIITRQLNQFMHHADFQRMEATWRGLHYLVMNTETGTKLKLRVLNATKDDLHKDITKAVEFDQSALFKMIYEQEYGTFGGDPYSVLIGDYEFGRHPSDMELLEGMSGVAAAAHAPFIAAAYAKLFDLEDFSKLYKPRDLSKIFESAELIKWRSFRASEDSRYVTLTLPRVLLRLPYGPDTVKVEGFDFKEDVDGTDAKKYLWGNPAYILGQRITNAFALYGWTAAIRGVEGGGLVEGLPAHTFKTADGDIALTCPTEVAITDRREKELNDLGFMAICHCKGTDKAAFFGGQSTNLPKKYNTDQANANARISSMLPYILAASRFAHYIKVIMREKVGKFMTRGNVEDYLNTWLAQYVLLDDTPPQEVKARYPLREGRVDVFDIPGKPGAYRATVYLKPHFQLEELTTSIRLVAELPA